MDDVDVDELVWATVRRYGRRGKREGTVWAAVCGQVPGGLTVPACHAAVERLVAAHRLTRHRPRRRGPTWLTAVTPEHPTPVVAEMREDLFGGTLQEGGDRD